MILRLALLTMTLLSGPMAWAAGNSQASSKPTPPVEAPPGAAPSAGGEADATAQKGVPPTGQGVPPVAPAAPAAGSPVSATTPPRPAQAASQAPPAPEAGAAPPSSPVEEGIWAWLERMDGEILPEKAAEEVSADAEAMIAEQAVTRADGRIDVPTDYYDDPLQALQGDPLYLDMIDVAEFDIPIDINEAVIARLRLFLGPHRKYIEKWLERKSRYEPMIAAELARTGLPKDIIYLSMIESGFNAYAYSSAHAAGLWQFIPTTGQYYGLDVDWWMDERRDPEKATKAAMQMLGELYKQFGDWQLAFAAYNTGPGRIKRALGVAQSSDGQASFWELLEQDLLHPETEGYVPKIIAAAIIGHHPERYGFVHLNPEPAFEYDSVQVTGAVDVAVLSECAGLDEEAFRMYNPAIRRYATPEGTTDIRVPKGKGEGFTVALAKVPPEERMLLVKHKVVRGETLSIIAGQYGVSSADIVRANGIRNPNQIEVGQWLVVPKRGSAEAAAGATALVQTRPTSAASLSAQSEASAARTSAPTGSPTGSPAAKAPTSTHRVRSGETLSIIADRYHVSVGDLQRWNGISNASHIEVGQVLKVRSGSSSSSSSSSSTATTPAPAAAKHTYTVRSGDTLSTIADRVGVGLSDLQRWNRISSPSHVYVGQVLSYYGGKELSSSSRSSSSSSTPATTYTVRSGDTLSSIATRFGISLSTLQSLNGIRDASDIRVGQVLKLKGSASSSSASSSSSSSGWISYTVRSGDSLGLIAEKYGVSVSDLRSWNRLSGSTIYPGQKLKVKKG